MIRPLFQMADTGRRHAAEVGSDGRINDGVGRGDLGVRAWGWFLSTSFPKASQLLRVQSFFGVMILPNGPYNSDKATGK